MGKPKNTRHTRKYPIVFFDTLTRPEPDPLPGILFNTRPDTENPYPLGTDYMKVFWGRIRKCLEEFELCLYQRSLDIILKVTL